MRASASNGQAATENADDPQRLSPAEQVLRTDVADQLKEMATLRAENARMGDALAAAGVAVPASVHRTTSAGAGRSGDGRLTASALALHAPGAGRQSSPPPPSPRQLPSPRPLQREAHSAQSLSGSGAPVSALPRPHHHKLAERKDHDYLNAHATNARLSSRNAWTKEEDLEVAQARELSWQNPSIQVDKGEDMLQLHGCKKTRAQGDFKPALYTHPGSWKAGSGSWSPPRPRERAPNGKA